MLAAGSVAAAATSALFVAAPAHAAGAPACTDTSTRGGVISPCMMIARANSWVSAGVTYDQGHYYTNSYGTYREDCAGFVAMAWHMTWSPPVTTTPPGLDDPSISKYLGTVASLKSAGQLGTIQPGDALVITAEHVVLFAGWTDASHTVAYIDSESSWGHPTAQGTWSTSYIAAEGYKVYRYNNDQLNNPTSPPAVTVTNAAVTSSTVTLTSTAAPAADSFYYHIQQNGVDKLYSPVVPGVPGTTQHTWTFNSGQLPNGTYQVVGAASLNGQIGTSAPYNITISNTPAPAAPTVSTPTTTGFGTIALTASAPGADSVTYKVDGNVIGTSTSGPDFSLGWNTATVAVGTHQITAVATNAGGTSPASAPATFRVGYGSTSSTSTVVQPNGTVSHFTRDANGHVWDSSITAAGVINPAYDLTANSPHTPTTGRTPTAAVTPDGSIDLITTDGNGHVVNTPINSNGTLGPVYDLTALAGLPATSGDASIVVKADGTAIVVDRASTGDVWSVYWTASTVGAAYDWTANAPHTPTTNGTPKVAVTPDGTVDIITTDPNGHVFNSPWNADGTLGPGYDLTALAGLPATPADASIVVKGDGIAMVFDRAGTGEVWSIAWGPTSIGPAYDWTANYPNTPLAS